MAGTFAGVPPVLARLRATQEAQDMNAYVQAQDLMPFSRTGDVTSDVCAYGLYPAPACSPNGEIRNRFGGSVTVRREVLGSSHVIKVKSAGVPSRVCAELVPMIELSLDEVVIEPKGRSQITVKPFGSNQSSLPTQVKKLCDSAPFAILHYTLRAL